MAKRGRPKGKPCSAAELDQRRAAAPKGYAAVIAKYGHANFHKMGIMGLDRHLAHLGYWPERNGQ
jgi:hypothetical protein